VGAHALRVLAARLLQRGLEARISIIEALLQHLRLLLCPLGALFRSVKTGV
jgi:hypothetical protein